jgi:hypothetical protein
LPRVAIPLNVMPFPPLLLNVILFIILRGVSVALANPNNPDLDIITMRQFLVKAAELGNPKFGAETYGLYTVSKL